MRSFRDPSGTVRFCGERVIRFVNESGRADFEAFARSSVVSSFIRDGLIVQSVPLTKEATPEEFAEANAPSFGIGGGMFLEHERIPFPSYPYEWSPEMLHCAGGLTIELAERLLPESLSLKDATPYNVLFRGTKPCFVDVLSVEQRDPHDPIWLPQSQFIDTFLLPLFLNKHFGHPLSSLRLNLYHGISLEEARRVCGFWRSFAPPYLSLIRIPMLLSGYAESNTAETYRKRRLGNSQQARFILETTFKRLKRLLNKAKPNENRRSNWSDYAEGGAHSLEYCARKRAAFESALSRVSPARALDVGCNTGEFSLLAARRGTMVVAIDSDEAVVGELWRRASREGLDVLPLNVNIARPSPALGWRNQENLSFIERCRGHFDLVIMLSLIHHLMAREGVPLAEILSLAAELTSDYLLIEFIAPQDAMFARIARGRENLFAHLTPQFFEEHCARYFIIVSAHETPQPTRRIYLLHKK